MDIFGKINLAIGTFAQNIDDFIVVDTCAERKGLVNHCCMCMCVWYSVMQIESEEKEEVKWISWWFFLYFTKTRAWAWKRVYEGKRQLGG